ncbi:trans-sulfuration enzyme family protein [Mucilaginibacter arboris]|uniref:Aminotransferase class V-fold PLP-dependent enzyme n=1 Tax=Mucilaginibacter arboris TaxID=2682090 RepID=A0A7K1SXN0_9SPHI|nr:PLP-dependent transferase [Mucilaginibacter arboris]MVN21997.1 aminotransferase class V-fold PLP-dependent enzyme [Mucilaginibacter arboris]
MKIETIAIHAGNQIDEGNKAVIQPITLSTTFERAEDGSYPSGYIYSRSNNPNRNSLENVLAKLENGAAAAAFSAGNAAGMTVFQSLEPGSHLICPDDMYHGLRNQLKQVFNKTLEFDFIDLGNLDLVAASIKPNTKLIWIETPSNPLLKITDLTAIVAIAKKTSVKTVCDNTFATPILQRPLDLGADLVMHSTTKYLGGHSDVLGGALIAREADEWWLKLKQIQEMGGAIPSPFDCYMTVRGIKTLPYRMKGHVENATKLAAFLESHPMVERVFYPGFASHPQHEIVKKQMFAGGGMLSFLVKGNAQTTRDVVNQVKIFTQATSLGGVESLIEHRASVEGPDSKTPQNLLRVSVGLENADDLIEDLAAALQPISN